MEFDKSKILTVVTAGQAKIGQKGWFGDTPIELETEFRTKKPYTLKELKENVLYPFETSVGLTALFYPAPEPAYAERQAEWVKEHNLQVGAKVRITRDFGRDEEAGTTGHIGVAGTTGKVWGMGPHYIDVVYDQDRIVRTTPYYVLEIIKEPTYRPFANAEEFKPYRDEWFVSKCDNSKSSSVKALSYSDLGVILLREVTKSEDVVFDLCRWDEFYKWFIRENGDPCGVREDK